MPLKIELKPYERLIIGGASIRNGDRRSSFVIETNTKFLRESDIIVEHDADTACKRLYVALEFVYLSDDPSEAENVFIAMANEIMTAAPSMTPYILKIHDLLATKDHYQALKVCKELIAYEQALLARAPAAPADTAAG